TRTGGSSASSSRTSTTRSVLLPSGIVSPALQFGTAAVSVGGSAGAPSLVSSLNRKAIRAPFRGPDGVGESSQITAGSAIRLASQSYPLDVQPARRRALVTPNHRRERRYTLVDPVRDGAFRSCCRRPCFVVRNLALQERRCQSRERAPGR